MEAELLSPANRLVGGPEVAQVIDDMPLPRRASIRLVSAGNMPEL